jgi:nucleotide-binding universal stress UspA family protein
LFRKMLIANDGSKGGDHALAFAIDLARRLDLALHMVCVEELPWFPASVDEVIEQQGADERIFDGVIDRARAKAAGKNVTLEAHVIAGHPVSSIVEFIRQGGYDLLVIGYMGHSALYNRVIGSTTDRLVELAPCTVMVIK